MKSRWITHKGKRILYCDYTSFAPSDFELLKSELEAVESLIYQEPEDSVLGLSDTRGSVATSEAVALFKTSATRTGKYIHKQAVIGISGFKRVLFDAVVRISGQNARSFDDIDQAKDWLVEKTG